MDSKSKTIRNKTVLITGGTGSFGKTMAVHLCKSGAKEVRIFSRDEEKQHGMRIANKDLPITYHIGDVRDRQSVESAMVNVDFVFHAAALKQVPSCEFFPAQAVLTNVIGSQNVIDAAIDATVQSVVCLSTDKAVFPINAMGMTKALMEKTAQAAARRVDKSGETVISCVRYGNVMYSRGSVVPLFVEQIRNYKPLTVTVPDMTRFLMPLRDAVSLVNFALENSVQGDVFVKKAPAASLDLLANAIMSVFERQVPIEVIGMRHGEKMYETLASSEELRRAIDMGDYLRLPMDDRELNYGKFFFKGEEPSTLPEEFNSNNARQLDLDELVELLRSLPEISEVVEMQRTLKRVAV